MVKEFIDDDNEYQQWAQTHQRGFVINTTRSKSPGYMVLHRSTCHYVRSYSAKTPHGAFTERSYIKVGADTKAEAHSWASEHGCNRLSDRCTCAP
jgi:hypothetical protein